MAISDKQLAYASWEALSEQQRGLLGEPSTKAEWSLKNAVARRTLTDWAKHPEVRLAVLAAKERAHELRLSTTGPVSESGEAASSVTSDPYELGRVGLESRMAAGDLNATKLWFQTYGKARAELEARANQSDWTRQDDGVVHARALELIPAPAIASYLSAAGWTVLPPSEEPA